MKRLGMWGCAVGLMVGCAAGKQESRPPEVAPTPVVQAPAPAPAPTGKSNVQELPECPSDIAEEGSLDSSDSRSVGARSWIPALSPEGLDYRPESQAERLFHQELALTAGPVEIIGVGAPQKKSDWGWGRLVIARPFAQGYCVVNGLSAALPGAMTMSLADSWRSADGRFAILLVKLQQENEKGPQSTQWVSLGTDGHRAWIALAEAPRHMLIAPKVTFFRNGKDLYLDIHQRYVTRLRLGADGHFVVPPQAK